MIVRFALASLNQTPLDWSGNLGRIRLAWDRARASGAKIVCFPELAVTGYGCEDMFYDAYVSQEALRIVRELALETRDDVMLIGLPLPFEGKLYNAVAVLNDGRIAGFVAKSHLARSGIHYEPRWFQPWPLGKRDKYWLEGEAVPLGAVVFESSGLRIGIEICEDAWVEETDRPCLYLPDVHLVFNASASHFSMGKIDVRERIVRESSRRFGCTYAYANLVGCESGRAIYDGELLVAQDGRIQRRSRRLYLGEWELLCGDLQYEPRVAGSAVSLTLGVSGQDGLGSAEPEQVLENDDVEFAHAATLGLWDYMRKSRAQGFALSLSGGVDSATVAVLVRLMVRRAMAEFSPDRLREILAHIDDLPGDLTPDALTRRLLVTAYQSTCNSGSTTRDAARSLAGSLGARHLEMDVDDIVHRFRHMVGTALGRELSWDSDDVALQNVQARSRGPGIWMIANIERRLLLTTSNRSEVAVGYATMDGDTCGGLAPIAGVQKSFLLRWLVALEKGEIDGFDAMPVLNHINRQDPTAELRPPDRAQRDEDDLMPFDALDQLERMTTAERLGPVGAYRRLCKVFSRPQAYTWTRRFFVLFATSQWKRERYAPSFHLDDQSLDPKTWARFPILSGCFRDELRALDDLAAEQGVKAMDPPTSTLRS